MITAFGIEDVREQGSALGVQVFLAKPVTLSHLWDAILSSLAPEQREALVEEGRRAGAGHDFHDQQVHVLVVEDNEINQQIAAELLQAVGVEVSLAANGREALDRLLAAPDPLPWTLVLMDIQMPVMDGHQAVQEIRRHPRFASLPVVAMTAHALAEERERCLAEGMNDHLSKPIDPEALYRVIARWGVRPGLQPQAPVPPAPLPASQPAPGLLPEAIPGLDMAAGLHRVAGKPAIYLRLLRMFVGDQEQAARIVRGALAAGDRELALRTAHTVRGVAANLGAHAVAEAAAALEACLKGPAAGATTESVAAALQGFERELAQQIGALRTALGITALPGSLSPEAASPAVAEGLSADLRRGLQALRAQVVDSDNQAIAAMHALDEALRAVLPQQQVEALQQAIDGYDFDRAQVLLDAVLGASA
jgi:CheY-like chemotaxis protein